MNNTMRVSVLASAALMALSLAGSSEAQQASDMSFFITSAGADRHCQQLAQAAGAGSKTWRAYLSSNTNLQNPAQTVNARDRIGAGPWKNVKGVVIATSVADLHSANNKINKETILNEKGERIKVRGDTPNMHDILTGSDMEGKAFAGNLNLTCNNWTSSQFGKAMLGHADREGNPPPTQFSVSWTSAHQSRGCTQEDLIATGGNGLLYCFAQ